MKLLGALQKTQNPNQLKGIVFGLLSGMCVSAYVLINRHVYVLYHVAPFNYTVTFATAAAFFTLCALGWRTFKGRRPAMTHGGFGRLVLLGVLGGTAISLVVFGQRYTSAVNSSIIITASIITTTVFSKFLLKDMLSRRQQVWLGIMLVGLYLGIVGLHVLQFSKGDLIILSASLVFGFTNAFSKIILRQFDGNFVADMRLTISGFLLATIGMIGVGWHVFVTSAALWPLFAGLFFWLSLRAFYKAVSYISVNEAFVLNNGQLFFTGLASVLLLSEAYSWAKFSGSIIVLTSIYFITKKAAPVPTTEKKKVN